VWTLFQTHNFSENLVVVPGIEYRTSGSTARNSDRRTKKAVIHIIAQIGEIAIDPLFNMQKCEFVGRVCDTYAHARITAFCEWCTLLLRVVNTCFITRLDEQKQEIQKVLYFPTRNVNSPITAFTGTAGFIRRWLVWESSPHKVCGCE
jgi:hypothetical protein